MSSSKADLLCSPNHDDKFVIFGQELNLYKVGKKKNNWGVASDLI